MGLFSQAPSLHISTMFQVFGSTLPSAVHLGARVSGPSQHTCPMPPQLNTAGIAGDVTHTQAVLATHEGTECGEVL